MEHGRASCSISVVHQCFIHYTYSTGIPVCLNLLVSLDAWDIMN